MPSQTQICPRALPPQSPLPECRSMEHSSTRPPSAAGCRPPRLVFLPSRLQLDGGAMAVEARSSPPLWRSPLNWIVGCAVVYVCIDEGSISLRFLLVCSEFFFLLGFDFYGPAWARSCLACLRASTAHLKSPSPMLGLESRNDTAR